MNNRLKHLGAFYTPSHLADFLTERVLALWLKDQANLTSPPKIIDPACGDGIFLKAALKALKSQYSNFSTTDLTSSIYGGDCDANALAKIKDKFNLTLQNSLLVDFTPPSYEIVIGNPPFGLSRNQRILPDEIRLLRARYQERISGKLNSFLLFMALAEKITAKGE
jgi:type I restriction-modification system DNA methylase subunit